MRKRINLMWVAIELVTLLSVVTADAQPRKISGVYSNPVQLIRVTFNADSTFRYTSKGQHPTFSRFENFEEYGRWTQVGDTIILNPSLNEKPFVESELIEQTDAGTDRVALTFNHIRRFYNSAGLVEKSDTSNIERLDFAFNEWGKKRRTRVTVYRTTRCTFAGYIPKEILTSSRTVSFLKPAENIKTLIIGCYELEGVRNFQVAHYSANHFTLNVYSNYYADGQLRGVKFLIGSTNMLYTRQKSDGGFEKDNAWANTSFKLKKDLHGSE